MVTKVPKIPPESRGRETLIQIKLIPKSSKDQILGKEGDVYRAKVTAPPVEGLANEALIELLAKTLKIPKRDLKIVSGQRSRLKSVRVRGVSSDEIARLLEKGKGIFRWSFKTGDYSTKSILGKNQRTLGDKEVHLASIGKRSHNKANTNIFRAES